MDLFESHRDFLEVTFKTRDRPPDRERNAPSLSFPQREIVLKLAHQILQNRNQNSQQHEVKLTKYDERLVEHIKKNGWKKQSHVLWEKTGFELRAANERLSTLTKSGFLSQDFRPTQKFDSELKLLKEKFKDRAIRRMAYFREIRKQKSLAHFQTLSKGQQQVIETLGAFRQISPGQAIAMGSSHGELKTLRDQGILDYHNVLCDQRPMRLYSLTKNNGRNLSGKDLARYGAGIESPATGIQRDHSKLLHDVSVVDAVREAKTLMLGRGYEHLVTLSEHQMYQTKTSANSDMHQRYADAYMTVRAPGDSEETVAIEFGNYAPSYMKEKMQGIDADHRLIYTHDANRAEEYRQALANVPGSEIEVFVIAPPQMEVER